MSRGNREREIKELALLNWRILEMPYILSRQVVRAKKHRILFMLSASNCAKKEKGILHNRKCLRMTGLFQAWRHEQINMRNIKSSYVRLA